VTARQQVNTIIDMVEQQVIAVRGVEGARDFLTSLETSRAVANANLDNALLRCLEAVSPLQQTAIVRSALLTMAPMAR